MRFVASLLLVLALAAAGCGGGGDRSGDDSTAVDLAATRSLEAEAEDVGQGDHQKPDEEEEPEQRREKTTSVDAAVAFRGDLVIPVVAEGMLRARNSAEIRAEIAGRVTHVTAEEGQSVRRGQLVARIDAREYEAAVEEARARYLQALSLLSIEGDDILFEELVQDLRDEFTNLERMEQRGQLTREERYAREVQLDVQAIRDGKFRSEVAAARSGVAESRSALERARVNLERTQIRAPFGGIVTGLTLSPGELVTVSQGVCTIVDNVHIEAEVGVLEADLAYVEKGRPVLLVVPALSLTVPLTVDVVSPQFDRTTRTCQVLIRLENEGGRLRPGMFVRAQIAGETHRDRLLVPRESILTREGRPLLFKVEDGRAKWLYVKLGESNDYLVEIEKVLQGGALEPEDEVVVSDHLTLAHDAPVKVRKTVPASDPWVALAKSDK
ncbi:MAG: efflux RND transporter periplasmic adaptor subunit [Candidatus Krumholzibacteria bacterium]|nr:efflux RND transporter periplasmic adaptor subunit [Candidatus Krumholzibacteria bacterium]